MFALPVLHVFLEDHRVDELGGLGPSTYSPTANRRRGHDLTSPSRRVTSRGGTTLRPVPRKSSPRCPSDLQGLLDQFPLPGSVRETGSEPDRCVSAGPRVSDVPSDTGCVRFWPTPHRGWGRVESTLTTPDLCPPRCPRDRQGHTVSGVESGLRRWSPTGWRGRGVRRDYPELVGFSTFIIKLGPRVYTCPKDER